jgi:hypothetical protein
MTKSDKQGHRWFAGIIAGGCSQIVFEYFVSQWEGTSTRPIDPITTRLTSSHYQTRDLHKQGDVLSQNFHPGTSDCAVLVNPIRLTEIENSCFIRVGSVFKADTPIAGNRQGKPGVPGITNRETSLEVIEKPVPFPQQRNGVTHGPRS